MADDQAGGSEGGAINGCSGKTKGIGKVKKKDFSSAKFLPPVIRRCDRSEILVTMDQEPKERKLKTFPRVLNTGILYSGLLGEGNSRKIQREIAPA